MPSCFITMHVYAEYIWTSSEIASYKTSYVHEWYIDRSLYNYIPCTVKLANSIAS